jgi:diguanylate cyclase (GGDEF)-like protein
MNRHDNQGTSGTEDSGEQDLPDMPNEMPDFQQKDIRPRESSCIDGETVLSDGDGETWVTAREEAANLREQARYSREDAVHLREEAAFLRENAARLREEAVRLREVEAGIREGEAQVRESATSREREARLGETRVASGRIKVLQEANARLVVATLEARTLVEQVENAKTQLDHLAHHDALTGLPNRMLLHDRLAQAIELASRQGTQIAVLFMDLDRFKHINDSLGHAVGDQLLQSVARRLLDCVRHSDTASRQGGDEFVVLLSNIKQPENAAISAQKILAALTVPYSVDQQELHVSVSIGIATYPSDGQDAETLLKSADSAMYHAKDSGRNNYKFFVQEMNVRAVQRQSIEARLHRALERQEFVLHYQAKIDLQSNMIIGVEALIRWQQPERGLVPPSEFIPVAEDSGLILPIGRWVLREACLQARAWREAGLPQITVAVNTSAREFSATDFMEYVGTTLEDTCLKPRYLELELTESSLMHDATVANLVLNALTDLGVKLAIDDFGTGYSSLSYLRQFPVDTLKIDRSFVNRMTSNAEDAAIVSAVIGMGKSLKLRVIAEGVETAEQGAFLIAQHCDEAQGYYFSRPVVAEGFATLLQTGIRLS